MRFRLLILRHAEAEGSRGSDHQRPLAPIAEAQLNSVAQQLRARDWLPQQVICSDAWRTVETWRSVARALPSEASFKLEPRLYLGSRRDFELAIGHTPTAVERLCVIGHNPGVSLTASHFADFRIMMGTANGVLLSCEAENWPEAVALTGLWELEGVVRPKW